MTGYRNAPPPAAEGDAISERDAVMENRTWLSREIKAIRDERDRCAKRLLDAQAELQTALGMLRLNGVDPYVEMRLQASLAMQHALLADLGLPMYQPTQMPEGWKPA